MRVLFVPKMERFDGTGSLTTHPITFIEAALRYDPNLRFLLVVKEDGGGTEWIRRYVDEDSYRMIAERVDVIDVGVRASAKGRRVAYYVGEELFKEITHASGRMAMYDVILSQCFPSNPIFRAFSSWQVKRGYKVETPLVGWSYWTATERWLKLPDSGVNSKHDVMSTLVGALSSDRLVFESKIVQSDHLSMFRDMFKPSIVRSVMDRSLLINNGVQLGKLRPIREARKKRDKPTLLWSGYFGEDAKLILEAFRRLYATGKVGEVILNVMSYPIGETREKIASFAGYDPWPNGEGEPGDAKRLAEGRPIRVLTKMPQLDYYEMMSEADIFVTDCIGGTYGLRFGEMMGSGLLGVLNDEVATIFAPSGYPFVHNGRNITEATLAAIDAWMSGTDWTDRVIDELEKEHDSDLAAPAMIDVLRSEHRKSLDRNKFGGFDDLAKEALDGIDEIVHTEASKLISKKTRSGMDLRRNSLIPPQLIRSAILKSGFEDVGGEAIPRYRRVVR